MKRLIPLIICALILGACNLPGNVNEDPNLVATNVAMILTNAPAEATATQPQFPVVVTRTPIPQGETALPTEPATPVPGATEPLATEPPAVPATPTTAPTAEPTPVEGDPAQGFGEPDKLDEFVNTNNVWDYEDDWFSQQVTGGHLEIISKGTPWWTSWYTTRPEITDFYMEANLKMVNCSGSDRSGLAFRLTNNSEFYFMSLSCAGQWGFSRYNSKNEIVDILEPQSSSALKAITEENRLAVLARGDSFEFYINGVQVGSAKDTVNADPGTTGFFSMSSGTINFETNVEVLKIWYLD